MKLGMNVRVQGVINTLSIIVLKKFRRLRGCQLVASGTRLNH